MAQVTFAGIEHRYAGESTLSLTGVDLVIDDGEFVSVLGPSGSGKSTLLRVLVGLDRPTAGAVYIGDRDVTDLPPAERSVATIAGNHPLYPHLTAADNIGFAMHLTGATPQTIARAVARISAALQIDHLLTRHPHQLSRRERQSVALARAIVRPVDVLVLDEPFAELDADDRRHARIELGMAHARTGTTTVFVTQDQTEAMALSSRIAILDEGRLQQVTTPLELYHEPSTLAVAQFFGVPPMNTLTAEITGEGVAAAGPLTVPLPSRLLDRADPVVVGVRAEDVHLLSHGAPVRVTYLTNTGMDAFVHGRLDPDDAGQPIVLRCPSRSAPRPGELVYVDVLDDRHVLFFDPRSGARL